MSLMLCFETPFKLMLKLRSATVLQFLERKFGSSFLLYCNQRSSKFNITLLFQTLLPLPFSLFLSAIYFTKHSKLQNPLGFQNCPLAFPRLPCHAPSPRPPSHIVLLPVSLNVVNYKRHKPLPNALAWKSSNQKSSGWHH